MPARRFRWDRVGPGRMADTETAPRITRSAGLELTVLPNRNPEMAGTLTPSVRAGATPTPSGLDGLRSVELTTATAIASAVENGGVVRLPAP